MLEQLGKGGGEDYRPGSINSHAPCPPPSSPSAQSGMLQLGCNLNTVPGVGFISALGMHRALSPLRAMPLKPHPFAAGGALGRFILRAHFPVFTGSFWRDAADNGRGWGGFGRRRGETTELLESARLEFNGAHTHAPAHVRIPRAHARHDTARAHAQGYFKVYKVHEGEKTQHNQTHDLTCSLFAALGEGSSCALSAAPAVTVRVSKWPWSASGAVSVVLSADIAVIRCSRVTQIVVINSSGAI